MEIYNRSSKSYIDSLLWIKFLVGIKMISSKITKPAEFIFNNHLHSILLGILLGDGNIGSVFRKTLTDRRRFRFGQGLINEPYMLHLLSLFEFTSKEKNLSYYKNKRGYTGCAFNTRFDTSFNSYYELFYENKIKIIPKDLNKLFRGVNMGVFLAYLFMDDGSCHTKSTYNGKELPLGKNLYFHLNNFTREDVDRFCAYFNKEHSWSWKQHATPKQGGSSGSIYIPMKDRQEFFTLVAPHIIPHFQYKLPISFRV